MSFLKHAFKRDNAHYERNVRLLFLLAAVNSAQFFKMAKTVIKEEMLNCRCEGQSLIEFVKSWNLHEVEDALSEEPNGVEKP